jgi:hypothetical protein
MDVPAIGQKRVVIVGATGMVGADALRCALVVGKQATPSQVFENRDIRALVQSLDPLRGSSTKERK